MKLDDPVSRSRIIQFHDVGLSGFMKRVNRKIIQNILLPERKMGITSEIGEGTISQMSQNGTISQVSQMGSNSQIIRIGIGARRTQSVFFPLETSTPGWAPCVERTTTAQGRLSPRRSTGRGGWRRKLVPQSRWKLRD